MLCVQCHLWAHSRHTRSTIDKEAVEIESVAGPLSERFTLRGGSVWSSHAWRQSTGYRETLCVQQYVLVTRTPLWFTWMTAGRSHLSLYAQSNILLGGHLLFLGQWDHLTTIVVTALSPGFNPTSRASLLCESHLHTVWQENILHILLIMSKWSLSYTVNSWSVCPFCCQVHICTTGLIVTPPPSSPVTTATVFTFPSETSFTSIPVVGGIL